MSRRDFLKFMAIAGTVVFASGTFGFKSIVNASTPSSKELAQGLEIITDYTPALREPHYTQNFGCLDPVHAPGYFGDFLEIYDLTLKAIQTKQPQKYKRKNETFWPIYQITYNPTSNQPPTQEEIFNFVSHLVLDIGCRFEDKTWLLRGVINNIVVSTGVRKETSAYSIEDFPSNALGVYTAIEYLKNPFHFLENNNPQAIGHNELANSSFNQLKLACMCFLLKSAGDVYNITKAHFKNLRNYSFWPIYIKTIPFDTNLPHLQFIKYWDRYLKQNPQFGKDETQYKYIDLEWKIFEQQGSKITYLSKFN